MLIMHKWYNWKKIFYMCPIVVFDRPIIFINQLAQKAAKYFWRYRIDIKSLKNTNNYIPKWAYVKIRLDNSSSSSIRNKG